MNHRTPPLNPDDGGLYCYVRVWAIHSSPSAWATERKIRNLQTFSLSSQAHI